MQTAPSAPWSHTHFALQRCRSVWRESRHSWFSCLCELLLGKIRTLRESVPLHCMSVPCPSLRRPGGGRGLSDRGSSRLSLRKCPLPCAPNRPVSSSRPGPVFLSEAGPWAPALAPEYLALRPWQPDQGPPQQLRWGEREAGGLCRTAGWARGCGRGGPWRESEGREVRLWGWHGRQGGRAECVIAHGPLLGEQTGLSRTSRLEELGWGPAPLPLPSRAAVRRLLCWVQNGGESRGGIDPRDRTVPCSLRRRIFGQESRSSPAAPRSRGSCLNTPQPLLELGTPAVALEGKADGSKAKGKACDWITPLGAACSDQGGPNSVSSQTFPRRPQCPVPLCLVAIRENGGKGHVLGPGRAVCGEGSASPAERGRQMLRQQRPC